jgi:hypothetical protein
MGIALSPPAARIPMLLRRAQGMRRDTWFVAIAACAGLVTGCVERRYVINSEPLGAVVLRNGQSIGATPADDHFVYYGNYHFTLIRDGYETLQVEQKIPAPWYEYPVLDFISENLVPWTIRDVRRFSYDLKPLAQPNIDQLLNRGGGLRSRGQSLVPPAPPPAPVPPPSSPPPLDPATGQP